MTEFQKHSTTTGQGSATWKTARLWELARGLPVRRVPLTELRDFKENCWFEEGEQPSCQAIALHARRIYEADLSYPVILSATGGLMDGLHRVSKAWLMGHTEIAAVQFVEDPEPDFITHD